MDHPDVTFVETLPRDGLPCIKRVTTSDKIRFIDKLGEIGLTRIDCVAFTHPRIIPEYADAELVLKGIKKKPNIIYSSVVPNEIGCRRAMATAIDEVGMMVSVSDYFNKMNTGRSLHETMNKAPTIFEMARQNGRTVRAYIITAFGCPYTGKVSTEELIRLVMKLSYLGAREISLVDATGMANPKQVKSIVKEIRDLNLPSEIAVHFHNTRNSAIANCIAAYEAGVRIFDTSVSGLSRSLYGATELDAGYWNVATEDLVHLFEEMGINTGINVDELLKCVQLVEKLAGKKMPGHLLRAKPLKNIKAKNRRRSNHNGSKNKKMLISGLHSFSEDATL
jgi:hydroxymethylglutaryl-CoA lyase